MSCSNTAETITTTLKVPLKNLANDQDRRMSVGTPNTSYINDFGITGKMSRKLGVDYDQLFLQEQKYSGQNHEPHEEFTTGRLLTDIGERFLFEGRMDIAENPKEIRKWRLLLTAHEVQLAVQWTAMQLNKMFRGENIVITGILKGVFMFIADLCKLLTIPYNVYFLEASSYKDGQNAGSLEILSHINPSKFSGRKVVLVDELFDHGQTLSGVKQALCDKLKIPPEDVFTCVVFQKQKKSAYKEPDLAAFNVLPDVWLVGYGLDDGGTKRGWPHVFGLPKDAKTEKTDDDQQFERDPEEMFKKVRAAFHVRLSQLARELTYPSTPPTDSPVESPGTNGPSQTIFDAIAETPAGERPDKGQSGKAAENQ